MPELPEVETTRRGIAPHLIEQTIASIVVRQPRLRWPIPTEIHALEGDRITAIDRRAKYLLMKTASGTMIWHLGMSGSMRMLPADQAAAAHEHVQLTLQNGQSLRFRDPRRFGALLLTQDDPLVHPLLASLGPEPLAPEFDANYLHQRCKGRQTAIKQFIMSSDIVVGVGNIYACESLFRSGINPKTRAGRISPVRIARLVDAIKQVLSEAIEQGGTTLQDFTQADRKPGYFRHALQVYGRADEGCLNCGNPIQRITQGQRATFYCTHCQK
jgi:formamidopyrimidine-DNA glycosylase